MAQNITYNMLISGTNIYAPTLIPNVVDPGQASAKVSCNMFKSESLYTADKKAAFSNYIRNEVEAVAGGHYYARGFANSNYQSASCTIPLAKCSVSGISNKRVACIALSISNSELGLIPNFDVGLSNAGNGWYPMVWGKGFLNDSRNIIHRDDAALPIKIDFGDTPTIITGSPTVTVLIEVGRTAAVDWLRATFSYSGKTGKIAVNVPRGGLFPASSAANPTVRFCRFMSLIPANNSYTGDIRDYSRMEGYMENLKLGATSWTATGLQHVWDVQDENVPTVQISTLADAGGASNQDHAIIYHTFATQN